MGKVSPSRLPQRTAETASDPLSGAELEIVLETARDLTSLLSTERIIERLLDRILKHLDSEIGSVLAPDDDGNLRILIARGLPTEVVAETRVAIGEGISGFVARTGELLLVDNIESDERFKRRNHERYYTRSCLSAPLMVGGALYGVFNVNNKRNRESFSASDLRLLEAIGHHAALALNNAKRYEEAVARSQCDPLTGLSNHRHFWESLEIEAERSSRYERPFSVVMLDIDHFKNYNDSYGHLAGDGALEGIAQVIANGCRSSDVAGRYGGEEFAIILPETERAGARAFAEKIRASIERARFADAGRTELTASLGVATYPADGKTAAELLHAADTRLYRAKSVGRNRVVAD